MGVLGKKIVLLELEEYVFVVHLMYYHYWESYVQRYLRCYLHQSSQEFWSWRKDVSNMELR